MKLSPEMIGALVFAAIGTAGFAWMAQRPAVEFTALKFGVPDNANQASSSTAAKTEINPVNEPANPGTPTTSTTLPVENATPTSSEEPEKDATSTQTSTPVKNSAPSQPIPAASTQNMGMPAAAEKPVEVPATPVAPPVEATQFPTNPVTESGSSSTSTQTKETVPAATKTTPTMNTSEFPPKEIPGVTTPNTTQLPESIEIPTNLMFDPTSPVVTPAPTQ